MQMAAHSPEKVDSKGPSPEVARKFIEETPKKKKSMYSTVSDFFSGRYGDAKDKSRLKPPEGITGTRG